MGNSQPVLMLVNLEDGTVNKYITLENADPFLFPGYEMDGAVLHDYEDSLDLGSYIYTSFS